MIVVSDTSPILNLFAVRRLNLLKDLYGEIVVPPAVSVEMEKNGAQLPVGWIRVAAPQDRKQVEVLARELYAGESEAIVLAQELRADLVLMDEKLGRRRAKECGLHVSGLLGVLAEAKRAGLIEACGPVLDEMIRIAGLWIGEKPAGTLSAKPRGVGIAV